MKKRLAFFSTCRGFDPRTKQNKSACPTDNCSFYTLLGFSIEYTAVMLRLPHLVAHQLYFSCLTQLTGGFDAT